MIMKTTVTMTMTKCDDDSDNNSNSGGVLKTMTRFDSDIVGY